MGVGLAMRIWVLIGMLCVIPAALAQEGRLKPMVVPGAGDAIDGLRSSIVMIKTDFGPGESIMVVWKLTNENDKAAVVKLGKNHLHDFSFEAARDGKDLGIAKVEFKDYHSPATTLEPGESIIRTIDLRAIHVQDTKWSDPQGKYEVRVTCAPKNLKSGWAKFRVTGAGEQAPDINPELAEKIGSLIKQLGDDEFAKRESAYKELRAIGKPALHLLTEAAQTDGGDPEVTTRCKKLIEEIRTSLAPVQPAPPIVRPQPRPRPLPEPIIEPDFGDF
jgi:hypothetical protein